MPEFIDILLDTETEVCNRIADLCNDREQLDESYLTAFGQCVELGDFLRLAEERNERLASIDREIIVRSNALRKLKAQIEVAS